MGLTKPTRLRAVSKAAAQIVGYSLGEDVNKPTNVRPEPAGTLAQLADCKPRELPTRAAFAALPEDKQRRLKHALPYLVGALLRPGERSNDAVEERTLITLDVEAPKPKANETANERAVRRAKGQPPQPQDVFDTLTMVGHACWVYTSLNHTTKGPRYRVVLPLAKPLRGDHLTPDLRETTLAVAAVAGIPAHCIDDKSWTASQPMFLPAKYKDGEFWSDVEATGAPWSASKASTTKPKERQHTDPVVDGLMQAGLYLREDASQPGKHYFRCPFAEDHGTVNDTQTVYWEEGSRNDPLDPGKQAVNCFDTEADHDGKPHLTLATLKAWLREKLGDRFVNYEKLSDFPDKRPGRKVDRPRFAVQTVDQFLDHDPLPWLIKGVMARGEICMLQGQSGAGKSFVALDMARCMATGKPWNGMAVSGRLRVGYLAAEGASSIRNRVKAMLKHFKLKPEELQIVFIADAPNLADEKDCVRVCERVLDATNGAGLDVLFVDTLARSTAGVNENTSEMSVPLKHLAAMYRATGATHIAVHHLGKDAERGGRGWSGIKADMDTVLEIAKGAGESRTIKVDKQRDGDESMRWGFELVPVVVGTDEDGEDITAAVVSYSEFSQPSRERPLTETDALLVSVMEDLHLAGEAIALRAVQDAFIKIKEKANGDKFTSSQIDSKRQTVVKRLRILSGRSDVPFMFDEEGKVITNDATE